MDDEFYELALCLDVIEHVEDILASCESSG